MKCKRCGLEISEKEQYEYLGETLCEDCYIEIRYPTKACDPWAVYTATRSRESQGEKGIEGLTDLQKSLYGLIKRRGKVTKEEILNYFGMKQMELQTQLAILRHCELIKGRKEGDIIYMVPFDYGD